MARRCRYRRTTFFAMRAMPKSRSRQMPALKAAGGGAGGESKWALMIFSGDFHDIARRADSLLLYGRYCRAIASRIAIGRAV